MRPLYIRLKPRKGLRLHSAGSLRHKILIQKPRLVRRAPSGHMHSCYTGMHHATQACTIWTYALMLHRYLGQLPNAFQARIRAALPQLLAVRGGPTMPAGSGCDSLALRFLLPQLQQCVVGAPETSVPGVGLETGAWLVTLRQPMVLPSPSFVCFLAAP